MSGIDWTGFVDIAEEKARFVAETEQRLKQALAALPPRPLVRIVYKDRHRLNEGDRFRFIGGDGTIFEVTRVSPCAAYYRREAEHRVIRSKRTGQVLAEFEAPGEARAIAPTAFVEVLK
jgi:hypothetical protein